MGKLRYFSFGSFFSIVVALFIFYYSGKEGWTIVRWVSGIYLFLTAGLFVLVLALALLVFLFFSAAYLLMRLRGKPMRRPFIFSWRRPWQQKKGPKGGGEKVIDAEFVEYNKGK